MIRVRVTCSQIIHTTQTAYHDEAAPSKISIQDTANQRIEVARHNKYSVASFDGATCQISPKKDSVASKQVQHVKPTYIRHSQPTLEVARHQ